MYLVALGRLGEADCCVRAERVSQARDSSSVGQLAPMLDRLAYVELLLGRLRDARSTLSKGCAWSMISASTSASAT